MRIRAPFAFSAYGRFRPSRNYVTKFFLANTVVDVPTIDRLPPPVCSVAELDNPERRIDWYEIEGVLMRPVMCRDQPATLYDIEAATQLVAPRRLHWFHDHPSALCLWRLPRARASYYEVLEVQHRFTIKQSDRAVREEAIRDIYERCLIWQNLILAPRPAPTWRVGIFRDWVAIEPDYRRWPIGVVPTFHFGIGQHDAASQFAFELANGREVLMGPYEWMHPGNLGLPTDGALQTALSFAQRFARRLSAKPQYSLTVDQIRAYAGLRQLYEGGGTDHDADRTLVLVASTPWPQLRRMDRQFIKHLPTRSRILVDATEDPDLTKFINAEPFGPR